MAEPYETLLDRKQVAEMFGVSPTTVLRMEKRGFIPSVKLPLGGIKYRPSSILKAIDDWEKYRPNDPNSLVMGARNLNKTRIER
jgi:predicted DNA-binding transcriptional regulator AlpA